MKKRLALLMSAVMLLGTGSVVSASVEDAANDPAVTLVFAEVNPAETTIVGQVELKFKEEVEKLSGGSITIDLQDAGVLGGEEDFLNDMIGQIGSIDMCRTSVSTMTGYNIPKQTILCLPYVFLSRDQFWAFSSSDVAEEMLQEPSENGLFVRGLMFGEEGFRNIFASKEISSVDSLKGLKIRVNSDPTMNNIIAAFGCSPTVITYNELYSSLQSGVVDGAENPMGNYMSNSFNEVAPYVLQTGHQLGVFEFLITDMAWEKLTENQQECIKEALKVAKDYNKEIAQAQDDETMKALEEKGVTFYAIEDKSVCVEACQSIIDDGVGENTAIYEAIVALQ